jgi:hypothetical protein
MKYGTTILIAFSHEPTEIFFSMLVGNNVNSFGSLLA